MNRARWGAAIFLLAAATLAYEIVLLRLFALTQWHHFAFLAISIALLGFGAGGTAMSLAGHLFLRRPRDWFAVLATVAGVSMVAAFRTQQALPFKPLFLIWDAWQVFHLAALIGVLFLPFFFASVALLLPLAGEPNRASVLYGANLLGSGVGAVLAWPFLFLANPAVAIHVVAAVALAAGVVILPAARGEGVGSLGTGPRCSRRLTPAIAVIAAGVALLAAAWAAFGGVALQFSEYKAISHLLRMPGAKVLYENHSSLGMLQVVEAPGFHSAQGLSLRYGGELPAQIALVHDADSVSAVNAMTSPALSLAFFDAQLSALAFHASNDAPEVLVLGAGGGSAVQAALLFGAREIALVDSDPRVFAVLSGMFGNFTGLAGPHPGVRYVRDRSRRFLERAPADRFDLVIMSAAPPGGSGPGTHSLVEVPALTPAGFQAALRTLKPDGLLAVACPLRHPPREFVKLVATAIEAARTAGIASPSGHIAATNTWDLGMLLISRSPMSAARIGQIRAFCVERQFELAWLPGMDPDARGAHQGQDGQGYGEAFAALFRGEGKALMAGSPFDLEPASDARPYFFSSLSWRKLPALVRQMGWQWLPYADWGALVLAVSAVMLIGFAGVLIPLPLIAAPRVRREERPRLAVALYFLAIGIGYMALELAALQRGMMLLGDPVLATTLTVAAFLVASGMGSLASARVGVTPRAVMLPSLAVAVAAIPVAVVLTAAMPRLMTLSPSVAAIAFFGISASLACVMGFPFALGVRAIGNAPGATAWAWTFNGFASVATPPIATALMVGEGVVAVFVAAVAAYAIAAIAGLRLVRKPAAR